MARLVVSLFAVGAAVSFAGPWLFPDFPSQASIPLGLLALSVAGVVAPPAFRPERYTIELSDDGATTSRSVTRLSTDEPPVSFLERREGRKY